MCAYVFIYITALDRELENRNKTKEEIHINTLSMVATENGETMGLTLFNMFSHDANNP